MHEFGLAEAALKSVLAEARKADAVQVFRVVIRIGELSGVDVESFRFAFESIRSGTPAGDAALEIESVPATARCLDCGAEFPATDTLGGACPHCQSARTTLTRGRELDLVQLELG